MLIRNERASPLSSPHYTDGCVTGPDKHSSLRPATTDASSQCAFGVLRAPLFLSKHTLSHSSVMIFLDIGLR